MATFGNKSIQLCTPKVKAACTGMNVYSNGFVEAWNVTWEIFLLKIHKQNVMDKLVPNLFLIPGSTVWSFIQFVFIVHPTRDLPKYVGTEVLTPCFNIIFKLFLKSKKRQKLVSLPHFLHDFSRKIFLTLYSINQTSLSDCLYFLRYLDINLSYLI